MRVTRRGICIELIFAQAPMRHPYGVETTHQFRPKLRIRVHHCSQATAATACFKWTQRHTSESAEIQQARARCKLTNEAILKQVTHTNNSSYRHAARSTPKCGQKSVYTT